MSVFGVLKHEKVFWVTWQNDPVFMLYTYITYTKGKSVDIYLKCACFAHIALFLFWHIFFGVW